MLGIIKIIKRGECRGLDLTQNHLKMEKKKKKKKKKICVQSGIGTHDPQITNPALNPLG